MRPRACLAICGALVVALGRAAAGDDAPRPASPWPVATLELPAATEATLRLELGIQGRTLGFDVRPGPAFAFVAVARPGHATPHEATLRRTLAATLPPGTLEASRLTLVGPDALLLQPNEGALPDVREALAGLAGGSSLELRIAIRPAEHQPGGGTGSPLRATWPGDAASFRAFIDAESERWHAARGAGTPYVPSRPGMTLAPMRRRGEQEPWAYELLEDSLAGAGWDGSLFTEASVGRGERGDPVVQLSVAPERQQALEDYTRAHVGQALALVLDGEVLMAPTINSPLRDSVVITVGMLDWASATAAATDLAQQILRAGSVPLRLLAAVSASYAGSRRIDVPLPAGGTVLLAATVAGTTTRRELLRGPTLPAAADDLAPLLLAAQAVGLLDAPWVHAALAGRTDAEILGALLPRYGAAPHEGARADLLALLGRVAPEHPRVTPLLVERALDATSLERPAARAALARPRAQHAAVADALIEAALTRGPTGPTQVRALLASVGAYGVARLGPLLDDPRYVARDLARILLEPLARVPAERLIELGLPQRLLRDPDPRVRGAGVWARLRLGALAPALTPPEALRLAAVLRSTSALAQAAGQTKASRRPDAVRAPRPAEDRAADLLRARIDGAYPLPPLHEPAAADAAPLLRLLRWLPTQRVQSVGAPDDDWLALLRAPEPETRALAAAAAALRRTLPEPLRAELQARTGDADADATVRAAAGLALTVHGVADEPTVRAARAFAAANPENPWTPLWAELLETFAAR